MMAKRTKCMTALKQIEKINRLITDLNVKKRAARGGRSARVYKDMAIEAQERALAAYDMARALGVPVSCKAVGLGEVLDCRCTTKPGGRAFKF